MNVLLTDLKEGDVILIKDGFDGRLARVLKLTREGKLLVCRRWTGTNFALPTGIGDTPDGFGNTSAVYFNGGTSGRFLGDGTFLKSRKWLRLVVKVYRCHVGNVFGRDAFRLDLKLECGHTISRRGSRPAPKRVHCSHCYYSKKPGRSPRLSSVVRPRLKRAAIDKSKR